MCAASPAVGPLCNGAAKPVTLTCAPGSVIGSITSAFYGRSDTTTCPDRTAGFLPIEQQGVSTSNTQCQSTEYKAKVVHRWNSNPACCPTCVSVLTSLHGTNTSVYTIAASLVTSRVRPSSCVQVEELCVGQPTCTIPAGAVPDPCPGTYTWVSISHQCAAADGKQALPCTCMWNVTMRSSFA